MSGTDELGEKSGLLEPQSKFNPRWRRRKKHTSEGIDEVTQAALDSLQPIKSRGLFCKQCRRWILWKDIHFTYEVRGCMYRFSWCSCGSLLKEERI